MTTSVETPPDFDLSVKDVAAAAGIAPSAVRFYEKHGLITARRTAGGQRRFDDTAACRIRVAKVAQRVGLTVRQIADHFESLPDRPQPQDWERFADVLIDEAESRTAALRNCLGDLGSGTQLCEIGPGTVPAGHR
ncbi:MerR family DNA-binding transcriptional regulator [Nocardioides pantholopis]|uniref:MerR family DNA-binding transcriptional regulator n=1 Tax=Nocardioides pantholopis TaxID=2483798 RepID=UPI000F089701|nr:MerR family DNA-binding transcriptional regulator [Nocardioides pantholopis]